MKALDGRLATPSNTPGFVFFFCAKDRSSGGKKDCNKMMFITEVFSFHDEWSRIRLLGSY